MHRPIDVAIITRHPVPAYFAVAFAVSWASVLFVVGPGGLPTTIEPLETIGPVIYAAMLAGPSMAGILMTGLVSGREGLRELLGRVVLRRVGARWYAVALLTAPFMVGTVTLALSLLAPEFIPALFLTDDRAPLLLSGLAAGLIVGICEELGWTGFAIPRMRQRYGVVTTGLLLGVMWGAWHFIMFWQRDSFSGGIPLALLLVQLFSWLPAYRVLMVWVDDRTGSVLVAMLMHASLTATQLLLRPLPLPDVSLLTSILAFAAALWALVGLIAVAGRGQMAARSTVLTYFALAFAISWGGILLIVGGPGGIPGTSEQVEALMPLALIALFAGPSIAGPLTTWLVAGWAGVRGLRSRLFQWRVAARWYGIAILSAPLIVTTVLLALSVSSPSFVPGIVTADQKIGLLLFGIGWGLLGGGLLEELGWTGFAVPTLRLRFTAVTTALIVGLLHGTWHFLIALWAGGSFAAGEWTTYLLGILSFYLGALPAYRVLMVWVYDRSANLLVAMLMHASLSASTLILQPPLTGAPFLTWNLSLAAFLWLVVAAVALASRRGGRSRRSFERKLESNH